MSDSIVPSGAGPTKKTEQPLRGYHGRGLPKPIKRKCVLSQVRADAYIWSPGDHERPLGKSEFTRDTNKPQHNQRMQPSQRPYGYNYTASSEYFTQEPQMAPTQSIDSLPSGSGQPRQHAFAPLSPQSSSSVSFPARRPLPSPNVPYRERSQTLPLVPVFGAEAGQVPRLTQNVMLTYRSIVGPGLLTSFSGLRPAWCL